MSCRGKMTEAELNTYYEYAVMKAQQMYRAAKLSESLAADDAHDICVNLFIGNETPWENAKDENHRAALIRTRICSRLRDKLRQHLSLANQVCTRAISVDEAPRGEYDEDGNETNIESALIEDYGTQAEMIRNFDNPDPLPDYIYLTRYFESLLRPRGRKLCRALKTTWTRQDAWKKSGLSDRQFRKFLTFFERHFAQCFRAYSQYSGKTKRTKFAKFYGYHIERDRKPSTKSAKRK